MSQAPAPHGRHSPAQPLQEAQLLSPHTHTCTWLFSRQDRSCSCSRQKAMGLHHAPEEGAKMHRVLPGLELYPAVWAAIPTTQSTVQSRPFFCFHFPVLASPPSAGLKSPQQVHLHRPTLRRQKAPPQPSPPSLNDFPSSAGTDLCPGVLMGFRCFRSPAQQAALPRGLPGAVLWGRGAASAAATPGLRPPPRLAAPLGGSANPGGGSWATAHIQIPSPASATEL